MEFKLFDSHLNKRFLTLINNIKNKSNSFYDSYLDLLEATIKFILNEKNIGYDDSRTCGCILKEEKVRDFLKNELQLEDFIYNKILDYIKKCNDHKHKKEKNLSVESVINYLKVYFSIVNTYNKYSDKDFIKYDEGYFKSIFGENQKLNDEYKKEFSKLKNELEILLNENRIIEEDRAKYKSILNISELEKLAFDEQNQMLQNQINILNEIKINIKVMKKLDCIEKQNEEILVKLNNDNCKEDSIAIKRFLYNSNKEFSWNDEKDFNFYKRIVMIFALIALISGIISTVLVTTCVKYYTTYSLFDNIWMFLIVFIIIYNRKLVSRVSDEKLYKCSTYRFKYDVLNYYKPSYMEKFRYKIFRILSYFSIVINALICLNNGYISFLIIFINVIFMISSFLCAKFKNNFEESYYEWILFTGKKVSSPEFVTICYCSFMQKYYSYDEYLKRNNKNG